MSILVRVHMVIQLVRAFSMRSQDCPVTARSAFAADALEVLCSVARVYDGSKITDLE